MSTDTRTLDSMTKKELQEELCQAEGALEDVLEERRFTLGQTGVHIGALELKTLTHRWERDENRLMEHIELIKARLEQLESKEQPTIQELEKRLADLYSRLPAHSVPPRMMVELEELEDAIERAKDALQLSVGKQAICERLSST